MSLLDSILDKARKRVELGSLNDSIIIRRGSLKYLVVEIDRLRDDLGHSVSDPHTQVRHNARPTERRAAQAALGGSGSQRFAIAAFIASQGGYGATDDEVACALDMMPPRVATRRGELLKGQFIQDGGTHRKTRNDQDALVWVMTHKGRAALNSGEHTERKENNGTAS